MSRLLPIARALALALPLLGALGLLGSCRGHAARSGEPATVVGTVLDAATGAPLPGIRLEGPEGSAGVSGRDGRFEMEGLRVGDCGEIVARTADGRTGRVTLRPLGPERLEVVVHLYREYRR